MDANHMTGVGAEAFRLRREVDALKQEVAALKKQVAEAKPGGVWKLAPTEDSPAPNVPVTELEDTDPEAIRKKHAPVLKIDRAIGRIMFSTNSEETFVLRDLARNLAEDLVAHASKLETRVAELEAAAQVERQEERCFCTDESGCVTCDFKDGDWYVRFPGSKIGKQAFPRDVIIHCPGECGAVLDDEGFATLNTDTGRMDVLENWLEDNDVHIQKRKRHADTHAASVRITFSPLTPAGQPATEMILLCGDEPTLRATLDHEQLS